jgi:uncharacterized membrane protein YkvA (DUF1232 family)
MAWVASFKAWAKAAKRDVMALYFAAKDPCVPWYAKAVAAGVVAYALSPIDLIPDFVPVLGHLDELIVLPLGMMLAVKLIPPEIMAEHRAAAVVAEVKPASRAVAVAIVLIWIGAAGLVIWAVWCSRR